MPFNGFTILQLSDLHSKEYGTKQDKLLKLIGSQNYDLVVVTGDLVDKGNPLIEPGIHLVQGLKRKPTYFVPGNHDWWTGFQFKDQLLQIGVKILDNQAVKLTKNGEHIWLVGVDDPYLGRDRLNEALSQINDSAPRLLMAHAPNVFPLAVKSGIDLLMVGHTHGGQVRLPIVGAVIVPGQGLFPEWDYGLFSSGKTRMVITAGLGESVLPIRFNIRPEIVLITLVRKFA